ncbi:MAG: hypothetical protein M3317_11680 [Actinomycetota bacterium]|nr:hypothetical protein [Actinomycetota bacterium]
MAAVGKEGHGAILEASNRVPCIRRRKHPVTGTPHYERSDLKSRKAVKQHLALSSEADLGSNRGQLSAKKAGGSAQPVLSFEPFQWDAPRAREEERGPS